MPFPDLWPDQIAEYRSNAVAPADFDAFWAATLAEARQSALEPVLVPVESALPLVESFDVTFSGFGGHRIRAWLIQPKGGASDIVVKFIGYNGGRGFVHEHLFWPATGRAVLVMDTRGQGGGWSLGATPDPVGHDPAQAGYMTRGIAAPDTYFYRRVFTNAVRAVEVALQLPGISRVSVCGGSQGGALALAVAGLMPGLSAVMPDVPFLCDFARSVGVASSDPYLEISRYLAVHRHMAERAFQTLAYFDGVHLAARATAPALISVAMMDRVCPPSSVYAAFNAYAGPKELVVYTWNDHEGGGPFHEIRQRNWLAGRG